MKKRKPRTIKITKESPEERKKRLSSGVKFRATVFESKKRKLLQKIYDREESSST